MNLIFIGNDFYWKSGTRMSSIYRINDDGSLSRSDWGFVQNALSNGKNIYIRPANTDEMLWAYKMLESLQE